MNETVSCQVRCCTHFADRYVHPGNTTTVTSFKVLNVEFLHYFLIASFYDATEAGGDHSIPTICSKKPHRGHPAAKEQKSAPLPEVAKSVQPTDMRRGTEKCVN